MKIIGFTGLPYSGKTEAVRIAKDNDIFVIRMGDAVWAEVKNRSLELNDKNVGMIADQMREKQGMDIWAKKTIEKIKNFAKTDIIVIDGIRNIEEIERYKKELGEDFILIAIDATKKTRYNRARSRMRKDDSRNIDDVKQRDLRELKWGLGTVIASADIVIRNEKDINNFRTKIRKTLDEIKS